MRATGYVFTEQVSITSAPGKSRPRVRASTSSIAEMATQRKITGQGQQLVFADPPHARGHGAVGIPRVPLHRVAAREQLRPEVSEPSQAIHANYHDGDYCSFRGKSYTGPTRTILKGVLA